MSKPVTTTLHLEWTPNWVRAMNVATGDTASASTIPALGATLSGHSRAIVGVGRSSVFLKTIRVPKANPTDLRRLLEVQLSQIFPLPASQLSFDFIQTTDQTADGFLTLVAAIRAEDLRRIRDDLRQCGITAERVVPLALASVAVAAHGKRADALVVESAPNGVGLDVIRNGMLHYSRVAPDGGAIADEAQRTMTAARATHLPEIVVGLLDLPNAEQSIHSPLSLLNEAPPFDFELTEDRLLAAKAHIAARTRTALLFLVSAILCVVLVTADHMDAQKAIDQSQGAWNTWLTTHKSIRDDETTQAANVIAVQNNLLLAFKPGQSLSDIENVVSDSLPAGAWCTALVIERGKPLQVRGTAKTGGDVAQFVNALGNNARFRDVRLVFANSALIGTTPVVQFSVTATCVGNLPLPVPVIASTRSSSTTTSQTGTGASS